MEIQVNALDGELSFVVCCRSGSQEGGSHDPTFQAIKHHLKNPEMKHLTKSNAAKMSKFAKGMTKAVTSASKYGMGKGNNKGTNHGNKGLVVVTANTGATVSLKDGFTHVAQATISKVAPNNGQGGTTCVITGTAMLGGGSKIVSVKLVDVEVTSISASTDKEVTVVVKTSAKAGKGEGDDENPR